MFVVVVVLVQSQLLALMATKQGHIRWVVGDHLWLSRATDMVVQANNMVCFCHYQVQVVRHHQNSAIEFVS